MHWIGLHGDPQHLRGRAWTFGGGEVCALTITGSSVSPRNGKAVLVIPTPAASSYSFRYGGDGYNAPSVAHAKRP